jgi:hypothetical protein
MQITEPVSMVTDYLLATVSLFFASRLLSTARPENRVSSGLWTIGFMAGAVAAFVGGTYHGFASYFDASLHRALWNITIFSIGTSGAFMVSGVLASSVKRSDESKKWLIRGVTVTAVGFLIQQAPIRRNLDFNHNDLYHLIQIVALYLFFKGARLLQDYSSPR